MWFVCNITWIWRLKNKYQKFKIKNQKFNEETISVYFHESKKITASSHYIWSNLKKCPLNPLYWHLRTLPPYSLSCSLPFALLAPTLKKSCHTLEKGCTPASHSTAEPLWSICHQIVLRDPLFTGIPSSSFSFFVKDGSPCLTVLLLNNLLF